MMNRKVTEGNSDMTDYNGIQSRHDTDLTIVAAEF